MTCVTLHRGHRRRPAVAADEVRQRDRDRLHGALIDVELRAAGLREAKPWRDQRRGSAPRQRHGASDRSATGRTIRTATGHQIIGSHRIHPERSISCPNMSFGSKVDLDIFPSLIGFRTQHLERLAASGSRAWRSPPWPSTIRPTPRHATPAARPTEPSCLNSITHHRPPAFWR